MKCNKQFKHSNFVTLSRFHRTTVNNSGLSMQLEDVLYNLSKQISIVIKYLPEYKDGEEKELRREGEKLALQFLERLVKIRELLQTDLQTAYCKLQCF